MCEMRKGTNKYWLLFLAILIGQLSHYFSTIRIDIIIKDTLRYSVFSARDLKTIRIIFQSTCIEVFVLIFTWPAHQEVSQDFSAGVFWQRFDYLFQVKKHQSILSAGQPTQKPKVNLFQKELQKRTLICSYSLL